MGFQLDYSNLKRIVSEAVILVCFAMAIGLAFNHQMIMAAFEGKVVTTAVPDQDALDKLPIPITLQDVRELIDRSVLVDARISEFYAEAHLPGAVSLPFTGAETELDVFKSQYAATRSIIIYCSGFGCNDSFDLGVLLLNNGYHDVMIYEGGYPEWRDAGLPTEAGTP